VSYAQAYKITLGVQGFWVWVNENGWTQVGKPFLTKAEAEEAIKRLAKNEVWYYDENGEAV
jgi:hypothetical protein